MKVRKRNSFAEVLSEGRRKIKYDFLEPEDYHNDINIVSKDCVGLDGLLVRNQEIVRVPKSDRYKGLTVRDFDITNLISTGAIENAVFGQLPVSNIEASDKIDKVIKNINIE